MGILDYLVYFCSEPNTEDRGCYKMGFVGSVSERRLYTLPVVQAVKAGKPYCFHLFYLKAKYLVPQKPINHCDKG